MHPCQSLHGFLPAVLTQCPVFWSGNHMSHGILIEEKVAHLAEAMPLIVAIQRLLQMPNHFIYTMLPSKDDVAVDTAHFEHGDEQNTHETRQSPRYRPWRRQT